jgi:hypothetical protein
MLQYAVQAIRLDRPAPRREVSQPNFIAGLWDSWMTSMSDLSILLHTPRLVKRPDARLAFSLHASAAPIMIPRN